MSLVYEWAFLTIVAAAGDDANAGLPPFVSLRLGASLLFHTEIISGNKYISSESPQIASEAISTSTWATRGWTLQEYALSHRTVLFTGYRVFFRCDQALWTEDFGYGFSRCRNHIPLWDLPLKRVDDRRTNLHFEYPLTYSRLVAEYLGRNLTKEEDILNAFEGVLSHTFGEDQAHIWGLPPRELGRALGWMTDTTFPCRRRPGFPSWTWAGWVHNETILASDSRHVNIFFGRNSFISHASILTCYKFGADGQIICLEKSSIDHAGKLWVAEFMKLRPDLKLRPGAQAEMSIKHHFSSPSNATTIIEGYSSSVAPELHTSHLLFFWTSFAYLDVDRVHGGSSRPGHSIIENFRIRTALWQGLNDAVLTDAVLSIKLRSDWRAAQPEKLPFIVTTARFSTRFYRPDLDINLGLILVEEVPNTVPRIYTRIQAAEGQIYLRQWLSAKPESRLIALV